MTFKNRKLVQRNTDQSADILGPSIAPTKRPRTNSLSSPGEGARTSASHVGGQESSPFDSLLDDPAMMAAHGLPDKNACESQGVHPMVCDSLNATPAEEKGEFSLPKFHIGGGVNVGPGSGGVEFDQGGSTKVYVKPKIKKKGGEIGVTGEF